MVNLHAQPQTPPPLRDRLGDFQRTKPPLFSYAVELMDADDWLKSVEKKLQVEQCNNSEKVLLASHQLSGPVADWWDAYMEAQAEPESINLLEFRAAFRAHHVTQGVIKLKKKEFHDLKQGSMSVNEYVSRFTQLSRYAPHEVDTDEKKHEYFLNGLNDGLAYALDARDFENFQGMVNKVLMLENHRGVMEHKRKLVYQHQPDSSSRPHVLLSRNFSQGHRQLDKNSLPHNIKGFSAPTISRLLLLGIGVFRGPKLPKTHNKLIIGTTTVMKRDITSTDAPIHALMPISPL
jgi:hypothetical protein